MTAEPLPAEPLPAEFFARHSVAVARELLGALLVHEAPGLPPLVARIVETEAYRGDDPACHAWGVAFPPAEGVKPRRGAALFGPPGTAYVYLCYGMHWLLNVVTEPAGQAGAVLIRAVEPVGDLAPYRARRPAMRCDGDLTNGPGRLTAAMGIGPAHHGIPLLGPPLWFAAGAPNGPAEPVAATGRIGIARGGELPWRFLLLNNRFVSRGPAGA